MFAQDRVSLELERTWLAALEQAPGRCIQRADGSEAPQEPWSCVPGTLPMSHSDLAQQHHVTHPGLEPPTTDANPHR